MNDERAEKYWIEELGFCGCYGESFVFFFQVLDEIWQKNKANEVYFYRYKETSDLEQGFQELCLMIMDKDQLTEHGSSVRGSWLTEKGRKLAEELFDGR